MIDYKQVLLEIGYSNILENAKELRVKPIYRDSDSGSVLRIKKDNGYFIDFARNISGSFEELIKLSLNLTSLEEAQKWLSGKYSYDRRKIKRSEPEITQIKIFSPSLLEKLEKNHSYWINRGVSEETLKKFNGGVIKTGKMAERYVFPIFNSKNQIVGFSGRDLINKEDLRPKWKHIGQKFSWVYPAFLNKQEVTNSRQVFLVESVGDMLSLYDKGIKNVLVTFGLDIGSGIINFLLKIDCKEIRICFNDDSTNNSAGNKAAEKAFKKLNLYFDSNQIKISLPSKKDFGEMSSQDVSLWFQNLQ